MFNKKFERVTFPNDQIYLPLSGKQYEDLVNELLPALNGVAEAERGQSFDGKYLSQILMSVIHSLDHKDGLVSKQALFEGCVNRISCHITYHIVQKIQDDMKAARDKPTEEKTGEAIPSAEEATV